MRKLSAAGLARPSIGNNIERNPLSLIEDLRPSALPRPAAHGYADAELAR
jgi:hypothetical protein